MGQAQFEVAVANQASHGIEQLLAIESHRDEASSAYSITMLALVAQAIAAADGTEFQVDPAKFR